MKKEAGILAVLGVLIYALVYPQFMDGEKRTLDPEARKVWLGDYVELEDGITRIRAIGPEDGEPIVMVHGFSMPSYVWGWVPRALARSGHRVVTYDLYGRGGSDRPNVRYDQDLYDRQLAGVIEAAGLEGPVNLAGLSMGGAIISEYADRHPDQVKSLTLIATAGMPADLPFTAELIALPLVGDWLIRIFGDDMLYGRIGDAVYVKEYLHDLQKKFRRQMEFKGFKRALLSTLRFMPLTAMQETFEALGQREDLPVLILWGRQDEIVPVGKAGELAKLMPGARVRILEETGHIPPYERPGQTGRAIEEFLATVAAGE